MSRPERVCYFRHGANIGFRVMVRGWPDQEAEDVATDHLIAWVVRQPRDAARSIHSALLRLDEDPDAATIAARHVLAAEGEAVRAACGQLRLRPEGEYAIRLEAAGDASESSHE